MDEEVGDEGHPGDGAEVENRHQREPLARLGLARQAIGDVGRDLGVWVERGHDEV